MMNKISTNHGMHSGALTRAGDASRYGAKMTGELWKLDF
jgi:hypothetical protein